MTFAKVVKTWLKKSRKNCLWKDFNGHKVNEKLNKPFGGSAGQPAWISLKCSWAVE